MLRSNKAAMLSQRCMLPDHLLPSAVLDTDRCCLPRSHVQDAMKVTGDRQNFMVGQHARCLYKMSEILYQLPGRKLDANRYLRQAEELYQRRGQPERSSVEADNLLDQDGRAVMMGPRWKEADYDALVYVYWR